MGVKTVFENGDFFHYIRLVPPEFCDFGTFEKRRKNRVHFYRVWVPRNGYFFPHFLTHFKAVKGKNGDFSEKWPPDRPLKITFIAL